MGQGGGVAGIVQLTEHFLVGKKPGRNIHSLIEKGA